MPLQRVCDAEKQARNTGSNGPRRVQGNGESGVFCNALGCVSSRGYVGILQSGIARGLYTASPAMKQGGTAVYPSLAVIAEDVFIWKRGLAMDTRRRWRMVMETELEI